MVCGVRHAAFGPAEQVAHHLTTIDLEAFELLERPGRSNHSLY